jgi:hypothetical protein|tara:strand:- start:4015 stop:4695 length:681 start_codon:yes stop_codon:yes gene_type:complete
MTGQSMNRSSNLRAYMLLLAVTILLSTPLCAQFKYNAGLGVGVSFPDPSNFNTAIADSDLTAISSFWMPLNYSISVQVYPSFRIGYLKVSSYILPNKSSDNFVLPMALRGISAEAFFTFFKLFEANFGVAPVLGKAEFLQKDITTKTSKFGLSTTAEAGFKNSAFGLYSWVGVRMYLMSFLAVEGNIGYLRAKFDGGKWKSDSGSGISGAIDLTKPFIRFGAVVGW